MVTIGENIQRIRDLLDNPLPQRPAPHQILRQIWSENQSITNALNNTGLPWNESTYQLNYNPNRADYQINVGDFGKAIYATRLTGNPWVKETAIQIGDRNKEHYGTVWQYLYGAYGQWIPWNESPEQLIFWRDGAYNPIQMVTVMPQPQSSQTYIIHYLPGFLETNVALSTALSMPEHQELVRLRAAAALLPYTEWGDDEAKNTRTQDKLSKGFDYQLNRPGGKEECFKDYKTSMNVPKTVDLYDWN